MNGPCYLRTPAQRLFVPMMAGVYLLAEGSRFYIGESINIARRFTEHLPQEYGYLSNAGMSDPDCYLLAEVQTTGVWNNDKQQLVLAEKRFMWAAIDLGLNLTNKHVP